MARRSKLSVESDHRSAASATGGLRCLLALDCVANIQQNLEIQLLAAIGEVERRHLCVVARGLRALERLAVHLVEVGKDAIAGSGHACLLQNVCGESGRLHAGWRGRLGRRGGGGGSRRIFWAPRTISRRGWSGLVTATYSARRASRRPRRRR